MYMVDDHASCINICDMRQHGTPELSSVRASHPEGRAESESCRGWYEAPLLADASACGAGLRDFIISFTLRWMLLISRLYPGSFFFLLTAARAAEFSKAFSASMVIPTRLACSARTCTQLSVRVCVCGVCSQRPGGDVTPRQVPSWSCECYGTKDCTENYHVYQSIATMHQSVLSVTRSSGKDK